MFVSRGILLANTLLAAALLAGCGSAEVETLTPAQIQKQLAEDKASLADEDRAESAFQKERRGK